MDPLLHSEPSRAQEYLQGLLASADVSFTPVLRRRPVPLTDGPPDDDYIVSFNIALTFLSPLALLPLFTPPLYSFLLFRFSSLGPLASQGVCPKRLRPKWQHLT